MPEEQWTFNDWKANYAHRIKLMAGIKTMEAALEMLPDDTILTSIWREGADPNDAAMDELATWDE